MTAASGDTPSSTPSRSPPAAAASAGSRSPSSRGRIDCVSGSPKRALNSSTFGPDSVSISPAKSTPMNGAPRRASSSTTGACTCSTSSATSGAPKPGTGENEPMPPVFGPASPSPIRLKSCAGASGTTRRPSAEREDRDLVAREQLLDHDRPLERRGGAQRLVQLLGGLADEDALARCEAVDLDDAGRPRDRQRLGHRHAGRRHHLLGERLRPFDPRGGAARAEDGDPVPAQRIRDAGDERRLRPDHGEVGVEAAGEVEQRLGVVGPDRMTVAELRDPGVARSRVQRRHPGPVHELPRERMLASARPDQQHPHGGRVYSAPRRPEAERRSPGGRAAR